MTTNPLLPLAALASALNNYYCARDFGPEADMTEEQYKEELKTAQILIGVTLATITSPQMPDDMYVTLTLKGEDIKAIYDALGVAAEDALS